MAGSLKIVPILLLSLILNLTFIRYSAADSTPIKLGATFALSGKLAFSGDSHRQGLELAVEDVNKAGGINGRPLHLIVEDNSGDPKSALSGINKLLESDSVDIIFSSFSHVTMAIKDRVQRSGKVMIYSASLGDIAKSHPMFFRDWGDAEAEGIALAKAAHDRGFRQVAFLGESSEACEVLQNGFNKIASEIGLTVIKEESYSPGETDFKPILLRISQKKPQALVTCTWRDGALLMTQLKSIGLINLPTFQLLAPFLPSSDTPEIRKLYEENKTISVWIAFIEGSLTDIQKSFFEKLKERFKTEPRIESLFIYDDVMILAQALKACASKDSIDMACTSKKLSETDYVGVAGPLKFDEFRRSNRPDLLIQVRNGVWVSANK